MYRARRKTNARTIGRVGRSLRFPTIALAGVVLAALTTLGLGPATATAAGANAPATAKRVLLLHSFGREFAPFSIFSTEFRTALARRFPGPIEFCDVSFEGAKFAGAARQDETFI